MYGYISLILSFFGDGLTTVINPLDFAFFKPYLTMSNSIKDNLIGMCLSCHQIYHMTRDDKVRKRINKKIKTYMRCLK